MEVDYLDLVGEGYMESMQWQLGREIFARKAQHPVYKLSGPVNQYNRTLIKSNSFVRLN